MDPENSLYNQYANVNDPNMCQPGESGGGTCSEESLAVGCWICKDPSQQEPFLPGGTTDAPEAGCTQITSVEQLAQMLMPTSADNFFDMGAQSVEGDPMPLIPIQGEWGGQSYQSDNITIVGYYSQEECMEVSACGTGLVYGDCDSEVGQIYLNTGACQSCIDYGMDSNIYCQCCTYGCMDPEATNYNPDAYVDVVTANFNFGSFNPAFEAGAPDPCEYDNHICLANNDTGISECVPNPDGPFSSFQDCNEVCADPDPPDPDEVDCGPFCQQEQWIQDIICDSCEGGTVNMNCVCCEEECPEEIEYNCATFDEWVTDVLQAEGSGWESVDSNILCAICNDNPDLMDTYLMVPEMLWSGEETPCSCCGDDPEPPGAQGMPGSIKGEPEKEPTKGSLKEILQRRSGIKPQ